VGTEDAGRVMAAVVILLAITATYAWASFLEWLLADRMPWEDDE
jgi:hypothetical protein